MGKWDQYKYAGWTKTPHCPCARRHWVVVKAGRFHVPMAPRTHETAWNAFRDVFAVATFGASTVVNGGLAPLLHAAIVAEICCRQCWRYFFWTWELNPGMRGKPSERGDSDYNGRFDHYVELLQSSRKEVPFLTVVDTSLGPDEREYDIVSWNCNHYSRALWSRFWA